MVLVGQQRPCRIFVLDSHDIFRTGVSSVLGSLPGLQVVGASGSFRSGLREVLDTEPDVALVGIREDESATLAELQPLRQLRPEVGVLVLTRSDQDAMFAAALQVGARAYLNKDLSVAALTDAIGAVAAGRSLIDPGRALRAMNRRPEVQAPPDPLAQLTRQEARILDLIAEGLSNREIAARLFLVEKTVRNHVSRVLAKLGVERRTQAALIAHRVAGYTDITR